MKAHAPEPGTFTGRHMLYSLLAFFGTVIAVNVLLAVLAERTWTGLVVDNSYVKSQEFNRNIAEAREQAALNWHGSLLLAPNAIRYELTTADGKPVRPREVVVHFRHPAYEAADFAVSLVRSGDGVFSAAHAIPDGAWIVEVDAEVGRARPYREVSRVLMRDGLVR